MHPRKVQKHNVYFGCTSWPVSIFPQIYAITHLFFLFFFNSLNEGVMGMQTGGGKAVQYYYHFLFLCSQESTGSELRGVLAGGACDGPKWTVERQKENQETCMQRKVQKKKPLPDLEDCICTSHVLWKFHLKLDKYAKIISGIASQSSFVTVTRFSMKNHFSFNSTSPDFLCCQL